MSLTPAQTATALTNLTQAETTINGIYNSVIDDTDKTNTMAGLSRLIRNAGALQKVRDAILAEFLQWDELKAQFDSGLITFEEFVGKINYEMMKLGASYDQPKTGE